MKKRILFIVLMICIIAVYMPNTYAASIVESGTFCENITYKLDSNGTITFEGTGELSPEADNLWFCSNKKIKKVIIGEGITAIYGIGLFSEASELADVQLPNSLRVVGGYVFRNCSSLENIVLPEGVTTIEAMAFAMCYNLKSVTIPKTVTSINALKDDGSYDAFYACDNLIIYGDANSYAEQYAKDHSIPFNGIVNSGECGYDGDNVMWSLDVDGTLTISGRGDMENFTRKYSTSYRDENQNLVHQTITSAPWSSTKSYYKNINKIVIEDGVTSIGDYAFIDLKELDSVTLPNGIEYIGSWAFSGCTRLRNIIIPESVITIKSRAFSDCSSIKNITLGGNIRDINSYIFVGCSSLESINVSNSNQSYCSVDGVLFTKDMTHILTYPVQKNQTSYTIPEGVIDIDAYAFSGNEQLSSIIIPKTVKEIYSDAFLNCTSIKNLTIPGNVERIGDWAFKGCTSLEHVVIEDGVERIGYFYAGYGIGYSFEGCITLKDIVIPKSIITIDYDAFENCPELSDVYYGGRKEDFNSLTSLNNPFNNASIHLNSIGKNPPQIVGIPTISENNLNINLTSVEYDSSLITVFSNDNAMVSFKEITISAGDNSKIVTLPDEDIANVKVFIWDSLERMRPLCSAQTLEIN